mmetsp:Transcript_20062/g.48420  ORF Transcript_20062/g.48420 Transcript_20062/m.48420 type:complete len:295 (-) Transcript_20062:111-995(-)
MGLEAKILAKHCAARVLAESLRLGVLLAQTHVHIISLVLLLLSLLRASLLGSSPSTGTATAIGTVAIWINVVTSMVIVVVSVLLVLLAVMAVTIIDGLRKGVRDRTVGGNESVRVWLGDLWLMSRSQVIGSLSVLLQDARLDLLHRRRQAETLRRGDGPGGIRTPSSIGTALGLCHLRVHRRGGRRHRRGEGWRVQGQVHRVCGCRLCSFRRFQLSLLFQGSSPLSLLRLFGCLPSPRLTCLLVERRLILALRGRVEDDDLVFLGHIPSPQTTTPQRHPLPSFLLASSALSIPS